MDNKDKNKSKVSVFLRACFKIVKLEKLYDKHEEVMLYLFFGALTTLISIVTKLLGFAIIPDAGQWWRNSVVVTFSWICAVTFAFFTNKEYVFENKTETSAEFRKVLFSFFSARIATFVMEQLIFLIFCDLMHINENIITIASQFIILAANYILSKLFVFKKKDESKE